MQTAWNAVYIIFVATNTQVCIATKSFSRPT